MYPIIRKLEIQGSIPTCTPDGDAGWRLPPVESLYFTGRHAPIHHVDAIKISSPYVGVNSLTPIRYEVHGGIDTPIPSLSIKTDISGVDPKCAFQMVSIPSVPMPSYSSLVLVSRRPGWDWHGTFGIRSKASAATKLQTRYHLHPKSTFHYQ